ncbi:MAG: DUF4465 domain-containing protein [Paludibacter sp.]
MKKNYLFASLFICVFVFVQPSNAQWVSDIDDLSLSPQSFWNGSNGSGSFTSGPVKYITNYNASWGSWSGFCYSNITDNTTSGYANQYSAITGKGALNSKNYAVGYGADTIVLNNPANMDGLYVTNSTYAYLDMLNGSAFSKKFSTNDWFKLTIKGFDKDHTQVGKVDYYLADFRFTDTTKNYILKDWQWVDLSSLINVSYITFERSSSDNGTWGMNTPDYFCLDALKIKGFTDVLIPRTENNTNISYNVYPNPSNGYLTISGKNEIQQISILDLSGRMVYSKSIMESNLAQLSLTNKLNGVYIVKVTSAYKEEYHKILFQ